MPSIPALRPLFGLLDFPHQVLDCLLGFHICARRKRDELDEVSRLSEYILHLRDIS